MVGKYRRLWAVGLALAVFGCDSLTDLEVTNQNNPETERTLATAADLESLIGGSYLTLWNNTQHSYPFGTMHVQADEGSASWGNWGMRDNGFEPRAVWNNSPTYGDDEVNRHPWDGAYGALSAAGDGIAAINGGVEIGVGGAGNARAIAFAKFVQGLSLGWLALQFDKAIIFDEDVDLIAAAGGAFVFDDYPAVMTAAMTKFDEAIALAAANSFTLDPDWIGNQALSSSEFIEVINSFKARYMAHLARSPAEGAAVNWAAVIAAIDAGINADFVMETAPAFTWWSRWTRHANEGGTWMRADYKTIGFSDESTGYIDWLATPVGDRQEFEMDTRDLRIWGCGVNGDLGGQCRSVDGSTSRNARIEGADGDGEPNDQEPGLYFRFFGNSPFPANRGTMVWSMYHFWRYEDVFEDSEGPMKHISMAEMELLRAEAMIQMGNLAGARDIINATRGPAGLVDVTSAGAPCPAVLPTCDLMDHLIYEKRLETWNTNTGGPYFDRRRWGLPANTSTHHRGLVEGTPVQYPVPGTELEVLELPTYTFGGIGSEGVPGPSIGIEGTPRMTARYEDFYTFERGMTVREKLDFIAEHFHNNRSDLLTRYW